MKIAITFLATIALTLSASVPVDETPSRYVTVWGDDGPELVDLEAAVPEIQYTVSESDISLHFYTRNNPSVPEDFPLNVQRVINSRNFDRRKLNVFSIHGWTNDQFASMNRRVRDASLQAEDVNLFVVDWSGPASGLYTAASGRVGRVGQTLGRFIGELQTALGLGANSFKLVGYSLGAHVAGNAGRAVSGNIGTIIALDAAGPLFSTINSGQRLRATDAQFVHVIHTNDGTLGFSGNLGHADIRPNGGSSQPGCGTDLTGSCAHARSYQYYSESIVSRGFTAWRCNNQREFERNNCNNNPTTRLGGLPVDNTASGNYFLTTNSAPLFSRS